MNDTCELGRKVSNQPKSKRNKNDLVAVIKSKNNRGLGLSEDRKRNNKLDRPGGRQWANQLYYECTYTGQINETLV